MDIEEFALGDSFIHRLDPRVKIVATLVFSVVVAVAGSVEAALAAVVFPVVLVALARISLRKLLVRLAVVNLFTGFLWLFLPFSVPGEAVWSLGPLEMHKEGLIYASLITLKCNAIMLTVITLLGTSPVFVLVHALSHMGVPDKLVHLFFFCFRYIHVIHQEYHKLLNAMKIRGFKPKTDLHTYRAYSYLVGMLLVKSFDRSQRILAAMLCRGFRGKFYILGHYEMKQHDYLLGAASILFCAMLLVVR